MVNDSTNHPRPCTDSSYPRQRTVVERMAMAIALCSERGVKLTPLRQKVLELLWESGRPTGAYEIIEALKTGSDRPIAPPSVYRALDFLISEGFVSKIESRNAYVACMHPERQSDCIFLICDECGSSVELEDRRVKQLLEEEAAKRRFRVCKPVVELEGTCRRCIEANPT